MWRPERQSGDDDEQSEALRGDALRPAASSSSPQALSLGDSRLRPGNIADPVWERWRAEISAVGGPSPLLYFEDSPRTRIELSSTHPGGLPQFIIGHSTLLSSLIRDDVALRAARSAAAAVTAKGIELRSVRGIDAVHLAIGLAQWRHGDEEFTAPILLRPMAIRRYGRDFELKLTGHPFVNPRLAGILAEQYRIPIDGDALVALAVDNGAFKPQPVIDELRRLTSHLPWFSVQPRLVVSTFADVAHALNSEMNDLNTTMLNALAGNPTARSSIAGAFNPVEPIRQDDRPPATDTLLLDADEQQETVVAQIAAGNSIVMKTLPGTGGTQTIVNAVGALVAQHKHVLVVSPRRSSLDDISQRLTRAGLPGLAVTPRTLRRDLVRSIRRNEKAEQPNVADIDEALVRLRKVLLDYRTALTMRDPMMKVSVLDALKRLSRLAVLPTPPSTTARLSPRSLELLAQDRSTAADVLIRSARFGEFRYGPDDSPWYGASFDTTEQGRVAHELAKRLNRVELPRLIERASALIGQTKLRPFESIAELGVYLRLLLDIRETLDKFTPAVFDRSLTELITATSSRKDSPNMSSINRRRLRKLALEYVRPGVHITDLNETLTRIQQQRILWNRFAASGVVPEVPLGIADVKVAYQRVAEDLALLDIPLHRTATPQSLAALPIDELLRDLEGLAAESEVLANLQERTALLAQLRDWELDPLLSDLAVRHVPESQVSAELELAWWQSALETLLGNERALLGGSTSVLDRLEADFRLVDEGHASSAGPQLAWMLAQMWKIAVVDRPEETAALKKLLRRESVTAHELVTLAPHLGRSLAPVWLLSPYEIPALGPNAHFDAVVLVDAGAATLAEVVPALRRAEQVVVCGDPVTQSPSRFTIGIRSAPPDAEGPSREDLHSDSALERLAELLPVYTLKQSYRAGGEDLAELVNHRFYADTIDSLPWAGTYLGHGSLRMHYVQGGQGMPDRDTGAVESTDAEVARTVELVLEHATERPKESLMVITASERHAVRVHQAVLAAFAHRSDLADFILGDRLEPFTVVTLDQSVGQSRDRVIFTIGYGRTPHGRVLSNFGALAEPGGERLLAVGMTRARRGMDIVSCFRAEDIDETHMRHGIAVLAQVLQETTDIQKSAPAYLDPDADPMIIDLAKRLGRRGLDVQLGYRNVLTLVASHRSRAVVVETDHDVNRGSLRESLRLRPTVLRRLGWHYIRVHSFELFADPERVAARVAALIGADDTAA